MRLAIVLVCAAGCAPANYLYSFDLTDPNAVNYPDFRRPDVEEDADVKAEIRFDPTEFKDDTRARIHAAIQKKVEQGTEISVSEVAPEREGKVIDLMEALRASLQRTESERAPAAGRLGPRKAPRRVEQPQRATRRKRNA